MKHFIYTAALALPLFVLTACSAAQSTETPSTSPLVAATSNTDTAILAGGCFWCVESDFEKLDGVIDVVSGYTGGGTDQPSYRNHGKHYEAAKITFDTSKISYDEILTYYWHHIDPTDPYGQFCDKGHSYQTAIFARPDQLETAQKSKQTISNTKPFTAPIVTKVLPTETFWLAEDYHQDFYKKNPVRYNSYRIGCGRDKAVKKLWGGTKTADDKAYGSGAKTQKPTKSYGSGN